MNCLAIESTAHTFAASVVTQTNNIAIRSNVRKLFTTDEGGLIPVKVAEHHLEHFNNIISQALNEADCTMKDIDLIGYSRAPGIGHCLRIGFAAAKSLAAQHNIPLVGVNHCIAHLEIGSFFAQHQDPVLLYASGANTQIIAKEGGKYRIFGETLDLGIGNFLDTIARKMDLGFPGGPKLEKLAQRWEGELLELPYSVKGMDVSFTGMQTQVQHFIEEGKPHEHIAFSVQEYAFAMLVEVTERALAHTQKKCVVLGGGVGCNQRLQNMLEQMSIEHNAQFSAPPKEYLIDNAAMIGLLAIKRYHQGAIVKVSDASIDPYERTDEVE